MGFEVCDTEAKTNFLADFIRVKIIRSHAYGATYFFTNDVWNTVTTNRGANVDLAPFSAGDIRHSTLIGRDRDLDPELELHHGDHLSECSTPPIAVRAASEVSVGRRLDPSW
jgi:hypothetical protein